jgi:hypothetical protein
MPRLFAIVACLAALACKKGPRYCDQDLSGLWVNAVDRHFAYRFQEDGGVVSGEYVVRADDGGVSAPPEPVTFELRRTHETVAGVMHGSGETPGGRKCPADFETRITDCKPQTLQVLSEISIAIGEDCKRLQATDGGSLPRHLREYVLQRPDSPLKQ